MVTSPSDTHTVAPAYLLRGPPAYGAATVITMLLALVVVFVVLLIVLPLIGLALWALVSIGIVGIVIGGLARLVLPGRQNIGLLPTVLLGWIGSLVGGFLGYHVIQTGRFFTVLLEIGVAALLIAIYGGSQNRSLTAGRRRGAIRW
jgi:uncharacterized membrane protein YeaQ/YmgE (transglycosylase-associated protein family)